jgi:hypothetical protein
MPDETRYQNPNHIRPGFGDWGPDAGEKRAEPAQRPRLQDLREHLGGELGILLEVRQPGGREEKIMSETTVLYPMPPRGPTGNHGFGGPKMLQNFNAFFIGNREIWCRIQTRNQKLNHIRPWFRDWGPDAGEQRAEPAQRARLQDLREHLDGEPGILLEVRQLGGREEGIMSETSVLYTMPPGNPRGSNDFH